MAESFFPSWILSRAVLVRLSLLLVGTLLALPVPAQQAPIEGAQSETVTNETVTSQAATDAARSDFFDTLEVAVVNVDVYVTDKQGNPVTDLAAEDFELFEDGKPMEITNFYAVVDGKPSAPTPKKPPGSVEPAERTPRREGPPVDPREARAAEVPIDQRLHLVLYFDNLFLRPFDRNKVTNEVRRFLRANLRPGDQAMLATFERSIHVRQPFTADRELINEALYGIEKLSAFAVQSASERRTAMERVDRSDSFFSAEPHVDFYAKSLFEDTKRSIEALGEMVESLAGLRGRKAILYVSSGIPLTAGEDLFYLLDQRFSGSVSGQLQASRYNAARYFRELIADANANRTTFYTLDASGLRSHSSLSAESGRSDTSSIEIDTVFMMNRQTPLQMMAADTGGLAAFNTNNVAGALDNMARDFGTYYSLGYAPVREALGRYHDIEVKVKQKGLQVRHRTGYRDKPLERLINEGTVAALLYGQVDNPLGIELEIEPIAPQADGTFRVPLLVRIPLGKVTLLPGPGRRRGQLRVSVAVIDQEGKMSDPNQKDFPIEIPDADLEAALQQDFIYDVQLLMRPGRQTIAVGVRDDISQESSFIRSPVRIGPP